MSWLLTNNKPGPDSYRDSGFKMINMKKLFLVTVLMCSAALIFSQDMTKFKLYNPEANAKKEIAEAVKQAKASGKHVLVQIGATGASGAPGSMIL